MKSLHKRLLSFLLVLTMLFCMVLTACTPDQPTPTPPDDSDKVPEDQPPVQNPEDEYQLPKEDGHNQLTLYWAG
ncbi:MAG: hypothetical protein IJW09_02890, partial [Clostridia bacterium]|nr:hypothetical protein [Clostridia bacterium]